MAGQKKRKLTQILNLGNWAGEKKIKTGEKKKKTKVDMTVDSERNPRPATGKSQVAGKENVCPHGHIFAQII